MYSNIREKYWKKHLENSIANITEKKRESKNSLSNNFLHNFPKIFSLSKTFQPKLNGEYQNRKIRKSKGIKRNIFKYFQLQI